MSGKSSMDVRVAIVGGGITGLAAAWWLEHDREISDSVVLEADTRVGGKIQTKNIDGHILEWGPQGFLDNAPDTLALAASVGLTDDLVRANEEAADRYIVRDGRLHSVPLTPPAFFRSPLLSLRGRLRVALEPFARKRRTYDESIHSFAQRRIGKEAADVLVDAMATGVFAGDSRRLSLSATFPRMEAMESQYGSLTRALLARKREQRGQGQKGGGPAGPGGTLTTFRQGMEQMPHALVARLGDRIKLGSSVLSIEPVEGGLLLRGSDFEIHAKRVLLTLPAAAAARLLGPVAPAAVDSLSQVETVPISIVNSSYATRDAFSHPVSGFGFLIPGQEPFGILGTLFCHDIFPGQVPDGRLLLRTMIGGAREPAAAAESDESLVSRSRTAHEKLFGSNPEPDRTWIIRHKYGIAQYGIGHLRRVEVAEQATAEIGIQLAGSPYRGVSVNDCIRQAREAAKRLAAG
ncbi:MAG: protoporphyrinogen oxidase [bacterium]|nr:protoporphyrinogen oxidase [bacterium]